MLTRLQVSGFKTFSDLDLDLGPFLAFVGPNAAGKSNLFDVIQLLSLLAQHDLRTAFLGLRGEPQEAFRRGADGEPAQQMTLAAEVLLSPEAVDHWGARVEVSHTRVRYELVIERRTDGRGIERLVVTHEAAKPILAKHDAWPRGRRSAATRFAKYKRQTPWLATETEGPSPVFKIHQDGRAGRTRAADAAEATVLSSMTSAEYPHLFALREEFRAWRFLQLDPVALRRPSATIEDDVLRPDGSNLAAVLARLQAQTGTATRRRGVVEDIRCDLAALIPGIRDIEVIEDRSQHEYRVVLTSRDDGAFSARVASDGTLRVLALLSLLHDPRRGGMVCFEEPENGIHPSRLREVIHRLEDMTTHLGAPDLDGEDLLFQVLVNSHSPVVVNSLMGGQVVFVDTVTSVRPDAERVTRATRVRRVDDVLPSTDQERVSPYEVEQYLSHASGHALSGTADA